MVKPKIPGTILPGEVLNPKGNPNPNLKDAPKPGAKTDLGKLKQQISQLRPWSDTKLLRKFRNCDKCPLRAKLEQRIINNKPVNYSVPAKCSHYEKGRKKCVIEVGEFINKLEVYFKYGEVGDTLMLQRMLTYSILENAELSKLKGMVTEGEPGLNAAKFQEIAARNLESVNRFTVGEISNVNKDERRVNINISPEQAEKIGEILMEKNGEVDKADSD